MKGCKKSRRKGITGGRDGGGATILGTSPCLEEVLAPCWGPACPSPHRPSRQRAHGRSHRGGAGEHLQRVVGMRSLQPVLNFLYFHVLKISDLFFNLSDFTFHITPHCSSLCTWPNRALPKMIL